MAIGPEFIARYRIVRRLGQGGMGTLYLAEDPSLDRLIAIKLLKDDSEELRERFIREARTAGRLKHVNIVSIFDVGEFNDQPFIAMEYVPGETLAEIIKRRAPLPLTQKLILMEELCAGLAHAHRAGIVHRDVKPANIMLDAEGTLKVLDFGIARWESSGMTRSGVIMGSLNYMSPELVTGRPIDQRSDVFAVGAVIYEFLTYLRAFPGGLPEVFNRILQQPPDQFESVAASQDAEIVQILERALAKDPAQRYQDLGAMRNDLQSVRQRLERDTDTETLVLRRGPVTPPPDASPRATELADAVAEARSALDAIDIDATRTAIDRVRHLGAESHIILALQDRLAEVLNDRQSQEWADEARQLLADGMLTASYDLARRAELLTPDDPQVAILLGDIERARSQRDGERTRQLTINRELDNAQSAYDDGAFEVAVRIADGVLALDPDNHEARTLAAQAAEARVQAVLRAGRTAITRADLGGAAAALDELRELPADASVETAALAGELQALRSSLELARRFGESLANAASAFDDQQFDQADAAVREALQLRPGDESALALQRRIAEAAVERGLRAADLIAQVRTALDDRRLDAADRLITEYQDLQFDPEPVRPLIERRRQLRHAADLARQFDDAIGAARSAFERERFDLAGAAIEAALGIRPQDEAAARLKRLIDGAVVARDAALRTAEGHRAIEDAAGALERGGFQAARASVDRALALDADNVDARRLTREIAAAERRAAAEREARRLAAAAEQGLKAGDFDLAAKLIGEAEALDAASEPVAAVAARLAVIRQAAAEEEATRRAVASSLDAARVAVAERRLDGATARLTEVRALAPGNKEASVLLKQVTQLVRAETKARQRAARLEHTSGVSRWTTSKYLAIAGLLLALVIAGTGLYLIRGGLSPRSEAPAPVTIAPSPSSTAPVPESSSNVKPDQGQQPVPPATPVPAAPPVRIVAVDSTPWGRVTMKPLAGGVTLQKSEETTPFVVDLPEGAYDFVLVADALPRPYTQRVQVTARGPNTVRLIAPSFDPAKIVSDILGARQP